MHSRQTELLATLRADELRGHSQPLKPAGGGSPRPARKHGHSHDKDQTIMNRAGWALVSIGLRLAQSG
jgi:hypothetical protein